MAGSTQEADIVNQHVELGGVSSRVCFNIFHITFDGNIRIVGWHRRPGSILVQVEMSSDGEDRQWAVVLVMRRVLSSIDIKGIFGFIDIHSGTTDVDVRLLPHVFSFCRNKLEKTN